MAAGTAHHETDTEVEALLLAPGESGEPAGVVAAAAVLAVVIAGSVNDDDKPAVPSREFSLADSNALSSCLPFDTSILQQMPNAFRGTVTSVTNTEVTLDIDHWFASDAPKADAVRLEVAPGNTSASLDGVSFAEGGTYLVTATNGTVNGCGFSGVATPELQSTFDSAFGS